MSDIPMSTAVPGCSSGTSTEAVPANLNPWCFSFGKRLFDVAVALAVLLFGSVFFVVIAALVKGTSLGPVFFRQRRVGQNGKEFSLIKFRSMTHVRCSAGSHLTTKGDLRVTTVGGFLRKLKLDELPQLLNVLQGDLSLVGPRPDMAEFMSTLSEDLRPVLCLKPGITSIASIQYRNEEEHLAGIKPEDLEQYYIQTLLPHKIRLDLDYAQRASFLGDLAILVKTAAAIVRTERN